MDSRMDKARDGMQQRSVRHVRATDRFDNMASRVSVSTVEGRKFKTEQGTAFTLCGNSIIGHTTGNGSAIRFNIPVLDVIREWIPRANKQDVEEVKNLACERLDELAA